AGGTESIHFPPKIPAALGSGLSHGARVCTPSFTGSNAAGKLIPTHKKQIIFSSLRRPPHSCSSPLWYATCKAHGRPPDQVSRESDFMRAHLKVLGIVALLLFACLSASATLTVYSSQSIFDSNVTDKVTTTFEGESLLYGKLPLINTCFADSTNVSCITFNN